MARWCAVVSPPPMSHLPKNGPPFQQQLPDGVDVFRLSIEVAKEQARVRREGFEFAAGNVAERVRGCRSVVVRVSVRPAVSVDNIYGTADVQIAESDVEMS